MVSPAARLAWRRPGQRPSQGPRQRYLALPLARVVATQAGGPAPAAAGASLGPLSRSRPVRGDLDVDGAERAGRPRKGRARRSSTSTHVFVLAGGLVLARVGPHPARPTRSGESPRFRDSISPVGAWPRQRLIMWRSDGELQSVEGTRPRLGSARSGGPLALP